MARLDDDRRITAVAALGEPLRRALYRYVANQDGAVSRDDAAQAAGVSRSVAAFHLDRLAQEGLLDIEFRRLTGRRGPGAGRPAKLYRVADGEIAVSLPDRQYDLAADLLAGAVTASTATGEPVETALLRLARERGGALAAAGQAAGQPDCVLFDAMAEHGYLPRRAGDGIVLANCPFHALAARHPHLVCGMNLALLEGFAAAVPEAGLVAELHPSAPHCCVRLVAGGGRVPESAPVQSRIGGVDSLSEEVGT